MKIGDLKLGTIDAKHEVLKDDDRKRFELSFLVPPDFPFLAFQKREKFIVYGAKGSGKTALLRYLEIAEKRNGNDTHFVLFRNEVSTVPIDEEPVADVSATVASVKASAGTSREYLFHWKLFLFGFIAQRLSVVQGIFKPTVDLDNFLDLFRHGGDKRTFQFKKGSATLDLSVNPKLALQLDFESEAADQQPLGELVNKAEYHFRRLVSWDRRVLCVFFDELELTALDTRRRTRDALLVRDLIRAAEQINALAITLDHPVHITLAVRSDVVSIASQTGFEINKIIQDFGAPISWSRRLDRDTLHPLNELIARRLQAAQGNKPNEKSYLDTWKAFFPAQIEGSPSRNFVLHQTWFKPRDVVRLLVTASEITSTETRFTQKVFTASRKEYAKRSWNELAEELSVSYDRALIEGIRLSLTGESPTFNLEQYQDVLRRKRSSFPQIDALVTKTTARQVLADLYQIGAVGNQAPTTGFQRWSFRGDEDVVFDANFVVHRAIQPALSVGFSPM